MAIAIFGHAAWDAYHYLRNRVVRTWNSVLLRQLEQGLMKPEVKATRKDH